LYFSSVFVDVPKKLVPPSSKSFCCRVLWGLKSGGIRENKYRRLFLFFAGRSARPAHSEASTVSFSDQKSAKPAVKQRAK